MVIKRLPDNELYHHGVKGQKWGVRRYQNADGSLTSDGKVRYTLKERKASLNNVSQMSDKDLKEGIQRMQLEKQYRQVTKDNIREGNAQLHKTLKTAGKITIGVAAGIGAAIGIKKLLSSGSEIRKVAKDIKNMSDSELGSKVKRMENEKKLINMYKEAGKNENSVIKTAAVAGATTVVTNAIAGAMAYSLHTAISGTANPEQAANYIAPNPKQKK